MTTKRLGAFLVMTLIADSAIAGIYTDELSKCLVESTTKADRAALVKWIFTAASAHPVISPISSVTAADRESANQVIGTLFTKLMAESCKEKTQKAITYEGQAAIQLGFQVLGQVAAGELFASPEVTQVMSGLGKYIDEKKLEALKTEVKN